MSKNNRQNREKKKRQHLAKEKDRMRREQSSANDSGGASLEDIKRIASSISNGPLGLAHHRPQPWAEPNACYDNVLKMVSREGGTGQSGWTFHIRTRPGVGHYVFAQPHAVWHNTDNGSLVDVTPHRDPKHLPVMQHGDHGDVLILVDSAADPVAVADKVFISPPLRFFAIGDSSALREYVAGLNERASADFERDKQDALARPRRR